MKKRRSKKRKLKIIPIFLLFIVVIIGILVFIKGINKISIKEAYISGNVSSFTLYNLDKNSKIVETKDIIYRGSSVKLHSSEKMENKVTYVKIKYNNKEYFINKENVTMDKNKIVTEKEMYVRTSATLYKDSESVDILGLVKKGEKVDIISYDKLNDKGEVNKYKIKYNELEGYVYGKYLVSSSEESLKVYDSDGLQEYLSDMGNTLGGGTATDLDYYPYEKGDFKDNVMPDEVRAFYLNGAAVKDIDSYIELAKDSNINAFVIDVCDDTSIAYESPVMKEYSPTSYSHALNSYDDYKSYVKKAKDAEIYVIGRITTFKDSYYVEDHKDAAILSSNGEPFNHNGAFWPSVYNRGVWEYKVKLAIEGIKDIGFNEIQFDYVRFPDRTNRLEATGSINFNNTYDEQKAQALQTFIIYATDEIHKVNGYVSIDVFGESASNYVTAYGQFWPAISNVADVISGMPYPDHFNAHEYGISEVVWTVPYKLLDAWGSYVAKKQEVIPTPAKVRTWIQAYDTSKDPATTYDSNKISDQIRALYGNGLTGGYMTWNSGSNINKYRALSSAFKKEYK